jgi:hypothetical protein
MESYARRVEGCVVDLGKRRDRGKGIRAGNGGGIREEMGLN